MNNDNAVSTGTIFYRIAVIGLLLVTVAFSYEAKKNADSARVNAADAFDRADSAVNAIDNIDACSRR